MDPLGSYGREQALYARRRSKGKMFHLLETSMEGRKSPMGSEVKEANLPKSSSSERAYIYGRANSSRGRGI